MTLTVLSVASNEVASAVLEPKRGAMLYNGQLNKSIEAYY